MAPTAICSFCGRNKSQSRKIVSKNSNAICDKCIESFTKIINKTTSNISDTKSENQLNSFKIREFLDQFVIGQEDAKISICVSVVNHYKRMLFESENDISKSNLMITGPSGSGKSLLVSTIAKFLNVPFVSIDATTLTEAGFIGQNVDSILMRLINEAKGDLNAVEHGIVFLDEVDKISSHNRSASTNGKLTGIQSALLKLVEGSKIVIDSGKHQAPIEVDTKNILFICGGAFVGINEIATTRMKKKSQMGFGEKPNKPVINENEYTTEDFIEYGMIPEFIGRFPMKTHTKELTELDLFAVLTHAKNNILDEYKFYFKVDKIDLEFTEDFITHVASTAKHEKTGVRGLRTICDNLMLPHLYRLPEYQKNHVSKMTFNRECITDSKIPIIDKYKHENKRNSKRV
jgi:ATP-dependent Clp protease ATP-binding subunit ClpX